MKRVEFKSIEDVIRHAASFALHDIDELSRLANSTHFDAKKFTFLSYKKVFLEIKYGLSGIFDYIKFSYPPSINLSTFNNVDVSGISLDHGKIISEIADQMSNRKSENLSNIHNCFVNPISDTKSFYHGIKDFTIDIMIKGINGISELYIYNPIQDNMLHYNNVNGILLNKYKIRLNDINTIKNARIGYISNTKLEESIHEVSFEYRYNNASSCILDFLSGKIDFVVSHKSYLDSWNAYLLDTCLQYGCYTYSMETMIMSNESLNLNNNFILGMRQNINILNNYFYNK